VSFGFCVASPVITMSPSVGTTRPSAGRFDPNQSWDWRGRDLHLSLPRAGRVASRAMTLLLVCAMCMLGGAASAAAAGPHQAVADAPNCTAALSAASDRPGPRRPGHRRPGHRRMAGWAFIARGYELSNARVSLWTLGGRRIPGASTRTGRTGAFTLGPLARNLPRRFVVRVRGGFIAGRRLPRSFAFSTVVHRRDLRRIVYIGLASTVVRRYLRAHPRVPKRRAATRVRRMLGVPAWHNLGFDLYNISPRWYSARKVMQLAAARGGMNRLVNALVQKVHRRRGTVSRPPFRRSGGTLTIAQAYSSSWFLQNLAGGVVSAVGSTGAGWLFNAIGFAPTPSYVKELQSQLNQLAAELSLLEDEISALNILVQQTYFAQQQNQLNDARSAIDTAMEHMTWIANAPDNSNRQYWSQVYFCQDIKPLATNQKPWGSTRVLINNVLVNVPPLARPLGLQGAILLREQVRQQNGPFWTNTEFEKTQQIVDFWDQYAVEALDIYLEYQHGIGTEQLCDNPPTNAGCPLQNETSLTQKLADDALATLQDSQKRPLQPLPDGYTIDLRTGFMWCMSPCSPASLTYNAAVSGLSQGLYGGQPILAFKNFKIPSRQQYQSLLGGFTGNDRTKWLVDKAGLNSSWLNAGGPNASHVLLWTSDTVPPCPPCPPQQYAFDLKTGGTGDKPPTEVPNFYLPYRVPPKSELPYYPDQAP
jgi:hypothetical protein